MSSENGIHPAVRVGHVHLHVSDLDRALAFYRDGLGFNLSGDGRPVGLPMAFLAAGDYHHHVGLNTFKPRGLYHVAFNYPDRRELSREHDRIALPRREPSPPRGGSRGRLRVGAFAGELRAHEPVSTRSPARSSPPPGAAADARARRA